MVKPIEGFETLYTVDEDGNIYSLRSKKYLSPKIDRYGYKVVTLFKRGKARCTTVHRLVAQAFVDNPDHKPCVNHLDENKLNNHYTNLEWATVKENNNYGSRNSRMAQTKCKRPVEKLHPDGSVTRYAGVKDAYRQTGITRSSISIACKMPWRTAGGYKWRYANE